MENLTVDAFHFCRYSCLHIQAGLFTSDHDRVMHLELLHYAVPHACALVLVSCFFHAAVFTHLSITTYRNPKGHPYIIHTYMCTHT